MRRMTSWAGRRVRRRDYSLGISVRSARIIIEPRFSKWGPELAALVPAGGELVITGVATDCCVLATAPGAVDAGRYVTIVSDACAAVSDEAQQQTLALLELLSPMCEVVSSSDLLARSAVAK